VDQEQAKSQFQLHAASKYQQIMLASIPSPDLMKGRSLQPRPKTANRTTYGSRSALMAPTLPSLISALSHFTPSACLRP
jgi:hypothetical protein